MEKLDCFIYATDVNENLLKETFKDRKNIKCIKLDVTKQEEVDFVYNVLFFLLKINRKLKKMEKNYLV